MSTCLFIWQIISLCRLFNLLEINYFIYFIFLYSYLNVHFIHKHSSIWGTISFIHSFIHVFIYFSKDIKLIKRDFIIVYWLCNVTKYFYFKSILKCAMYHARTHVHFCELWGHSIGKMLFILYTPYFLSPYTQGHIKTALGPGAMTYCRAPITIMIYIYIYIYIYMGYIYIKP